MRIIQLGYRGFQCLHSIVQTLERAIASRITKCYFFVLGVQVKTGLHVASLPICRRHAKAKISLGSHVKISNRIRENLAGVCHKTVLVANRPEARLIIGNHVAMSGAIFFCSNEIVVEDYVNIGVGVRIYDTDFHPLAAQARRMHVKSLIKTAPVRICEDVWLGANVIVLKGVTVGARSVVAAGSVVTQDIPSDTLAAGVPARVVRSLSSVDAS